jgi:predicted Zn-dependent protease
MELMLTQEHIVNSLFTGQFRSLNKYDRYAFADAEENTLIANITVRRFILANGQALAEAEYTVLFVPNTGESQIHYFGPDGNDYCWLMDMKSGLSVEL